MAFDLTGLWSCDDGGTYVVRQIGDTVWWLGLSKDNALFPGLDAEDGVFYPGLRFCNVFNGQMIQQSVSGQWSDVPRGATASQGDMFLLYVDAANPGDQQLLKDQNATTGGFGGSTWKRFLTPPAVRSAGELFTHTYKDAQGAGNQETLFDNLRLVRDSASVFGIVKQAGTSEQMQNPVTVNYPASRGRDYHSFICGGSGHDGRGDGDLTFFILADTAQIQRRQPNFFAGVDQGTRADVLDNMLSPFEGEIIMYGRAPDCNHWDATSWALFPGWAEPPGSSVLFNGKPIPVVLTPPGAGSNQPNFVADLHFEDPVRVTGALVYDHGHSFQPDGLEIHPVYSVEKILPTASAGDLSGTWADDFGNTYYLRHNLADNTVWYAGLSPVGSQTFGQVFRGTFDPGNSTVTGLIAALSFGFEASAPPLGFSPTPLGDTGHVIFNLGSMSLLNTQVKTLLVGNFLLMKLYDDPFGQAVAFQAANTGNLWTVGPDGRTDHGLGIRAGTSPSIAAVAGGGYEVAFQAANTGNLWTVGPDGRTDHGLGMMAGTSPSIAAVAGGYEVAFQAANTGNLWTVGPDGRTDHGLGMMAGTSPSIAAVAGGYEVAFQAANTGNLWTVGPDGATDHGLGMMAGTSPSIVRQVGVLPFVAVYEVAFQANTGNLWTFGPDGATDHGLGMMAGTSPSIAAVAGGYEVAFQANTGNLWTVGPDGRTDHRLGMMAGTSPSIAAVAGGYEVAFQANTGNLWTVGPAGGGDRGLGIMAGTSPSSTGRSFR